MVTLTDGEAHAVKQAIDNYLPELEYELARIKLERDRRGLVALDEMLRQIRNRL
jgi:hypothetical protein